MKLPNLFFIVIAIALFCLVLTNHALAKLPTGFPYRVLRPTSDQSKVQKLSIAERYSTPPMEKDSVQMITKLASSTPEEKKLLQPQFRQFMAARFKSHSDKILNDTLLTQDGKPDFHEFWIDWYYATPEQRALLLIKFRDLLKSKNQESKIFSVIDDGCGAAIEHGYTFGCGTYTKSQFDLNLNTAKSLTHQNEFAMAEEVYRTTLDHTYSQSCLDMPHDAIVGYKDLLIKSGHSKEADQL